MADRRDVTDWAGGGSTWEPEPEPPKKDEPPPRKPEREDKKREPEKPAPKRGAAPTTVGGTGLVCGRFLPLHRGHQYVIDVARHTVQDLLVLVFASPGDPVPGELRVRWLRELYPEVAVELVERTATAARTAPGVDELVRVVGRRAPRYFFASEVAYDAAARALGATFVPVDPTRARFPTSGTALRADVMQHFRMLPEAVRPWFVRRVAVVGAESTGKTTLCARLAEAYATTYVPEYARTLAAARGGELDADALALAARGQIASEDVLARTADRVLFCDTDARSLALWSERVAGSAPAWLHAAADARPYDLVLATSLDEPFVGRPDRDRPAERRAFHARVVAGYRELVELHGDRAARFEQARAAVDALLARGGLLSARGARMS